MELLNEKLSVGDKLTRHDVNNKLTVIQSNAYRRRLRVKASESPAFRAGRSACSTPISTEIPAFKSYEQLLDNTIKWMQTKQKSTNTKKMARQILNQLNRKTDLHDPKTVSQTILEATYEGTNKPLTNQTKRKWQLMYFYFCKANEIEGYTHIKYKCEETIPIIPSKSQVERIISAASKDYITIFTLMAEIAVEGEELHRTSRYQIDLEQRIITIKGTKGHSTANYKLKATTNQMLTEYLSKHTKDFPFPSAKLMAQAWRNARDNLAEATMNPDLKKIPMKNLRNYSGAQLYLSLPVRDPIQVMRHFRHKKIETTMHYIRAIILPLEEDIEYHTIAVNTKEEAIAASDKGYSYISTTPDGFMLFRKRKA